jgi:hypothetical protein
MEDDRKTKTMRMKTTSSFAKAKKLRRRYGFASILKTSAIDFIGAISLKTAYLKFRIPYQIRKCRERPIEVSDVLRQPDNQKGPAL